MEELKSCPFCGSDAEIIKLPGHKGYKVGEWKIAMAVCCQNINCAANMGNYYEKQDAITAWNTRVKPRLPYAVGDTVYFLSPLKTAICTGTISTIKISRFGYDFDIFQANINTTVKKESEKIFTTYTEAEQNLKEMRTNA